MFIFIKEFKDYVSERDSIPILLFLPYLKDVKSVSSSGKRYYYQDFIHAVRDSYDLLVCDPLPSILKSKNIDVLYRSDRYGGHLSSHGNKFISRVMYSFMQKKRISFF